jgi:hypothetical protein
MAIKVSQITVIDDTRNVSNVINVRASTVYANSGFFENNPNVSANYTITNRNALSAGPITINPGITITVGADSRWSIV